MVPRSFDRRMRRLGDSPPLVELRVEQDIECVFHPNLSFSVVVVDAVQTVTLELRGVDKLAPGTVVTGKVFVILHILEFTLELFVLFQALLAEVFAHGVESSEDFTLELLFPVLQLLLNLRVLEDVLVVKSMDLNKLIAIVFVEPAETVRYERKEIRREFGEGGGVRPQELNPGGELYCFIQGLEVFLVFFRMSTAGTTVAVVFDIGDGIFHFATSCGVFCAAFTTL